MSNCGIGVLYQVLPPPVIDGLRKEAKLGGYSDGGADIAFALGAAGRAVVKPSEVSDPECALDWVFPDSREGIEAAMVAGAGTLWANTVLFEGHPLEAFMSCVRIVGQTPAAMQAHDDKSETNRLLGRNGLMVARSALVSRTERTGVLALEGLEAALATRGLTLPLIVKPVRGRGSQGVTLVPVLEALRPTIVDLLTDGRFGDTVMIEEFLSGEELTVTVMPPASPMPDGHKSPTHWPLRPVIRFDQKNGVAPYNGDVPVTNNSVALDERRLNTPKIALMLDACVRAAEIVGSRSAIRIDCRAGPNGIFRIFDLNMKPNLTGSGRPGRDDQDSLTAMAARADGWTYAELLTSMLAAAWKDR